MTKGASTPDLARKIGMSETTAWFLSHKILEDDQRQLEPMVENAEEALGCLPSGVVADAGY